MITFGLLLAFKAGTYIPIPLFDATQVKSIFEEANFFGILNAFGTKAEGFVPQVLNGCIYCHQFGTIVEGFII